MLKRIWKKWHVSPQHWHYFRNVHPHLVFPEGQMTFDARKSIHKDRGRFFFYFSRFFLLNFSYLSYTRMEAEFYAWHHQQFRHLNSTISWPVLSNDDPDEQNAPMNMALNMRNVKIQRGVGNKILLRRHVQHRVSTHIFFSIKLL